jgi:hypothetical protein
MLNPLIAHHNFPIAILLDDILEMEIGMIKEDFDDKLKHENINRIMLALRPALQLEYTYLDENATKNRATIRCGRRL